MVGGREVGKTSLAHYISVLISEGQCDKPRIPVIVDYRSFKGNLYSLRRAAAAYLGTLRTGFDFDAAMEDGNLIIVIDNYSGVDRSLKAELQTMLGQYPGVKWMLLADSRFGSLNKEAKDNDLISDFRVAKIATLPRRSIRAMVKRWCDRTGAGDEETFTTVMHQIRSGDLPRTGYIVTLLLWSLQQNMKLERINESVLIMNMVDYLLGKADFRSALEGEFDATSKEITLQSFAVFVRENQQVVDVNAATEFLIGFFRDKGLNYDAGKVLNILGACGILATQADSVSFKYRCFQEYFLAKHMGSSDSRYKASYFNREYLKNVRELEILSGLARENDTFIDEIVFQIESYSPEAIDSISLDRFEDVIEEESSVGISREKLRKIRKKRLTATQIDDLKDAAEAQLSGGSRPKVAEKKNAKAARANATYQKDSSFTGGASDGLTIKSQPRLDVLSFMATLSLLGKVLRNSEFTSKERKTKGVRLYTQSSARFFLLLYEVVSDVFTHMVDAINEDEAVFDEEAIRGLHYFLTKRMMLFVEERMVEDLASVKLIPVMEEILASVDVSVSEKTFLVGLQLDCPNKNWDKHWIDHSKDVKKHRIAIEFLADKLWQHIHRKALGSKEQGKVEAVALELELALGRPRASKGVILQGIRSATQGSGHKDDE